jgi:hypothetical protein
MPRPTLACYTRVVQLGNLLQKLDKGGRNRLQHSLGNSQDRLVGFLKEQALCLMPVSIVPGKTRCLRALHSARMK